MSDMERPTEPTGDDSAEVEDQDSDPTMNAPQTERPDGLDESAADTQG
jgi:hypothetical protein